MKDRLIVHYLRQLVSILSLGGQPGLRKRLFVSYTRLFFRYILAVKFSIKKKAPVRIGRFTIPPTDFGVLRHLFEELFIERIYALALDSDRPVIIDCGSNIGMSVLFFKEEYPQARILAFEPDPDNFRHLQSAVSGNFSDVAIYNKAVSDEPGQMQLYASPDSHGGITTKSLYRERLDDTAVASASVEVVRLSEYLKLPVDLLKIDVEGAEISVLRDLIATGTISRVAKMIVEFHDIKHEGRPPLSEFLATLEEQGFELKLAAEPPRSRGRVDTREARDILIYASRA